MAKIGQISKWITSFETRSFFTENDVYQRFIDDFVYGTKSQVGYFHLYDAKTQNISLTAWSERSYSICATSHTTHYPLSQAGVWADSIRQKSYVIHNQMGEDKRFENLPEGHLALTNHMSMPVENNGKIVAVIGVGNRKDGYSKNLAALSRRIANKAWPSIGIAISGIKSRNCKRVRAFTEKNPKDMLVEMVGAIIGSLELRDEYTYAHQREVAELSKMVAIEMGPSEFEQTGVTLAALVHDIGKIGLPASILNKTGRLTPAEFELMKQHTSLGAQVFDNVQLPWNIASAIEQHHERLDGSGYPFGLRKGQISLEARIIAVCDTYQSMSTDRPYRSAVEPGKALEELKEGREI